MKDDKYFAGGFKTLNEKGKHVTEIDNLINNNKIKEIEFFKSNYLASKKVGAWLGLYKVL